MRIAPRSRAKRGARTAPPTARSKTVHIVLFAGAGVALATSIVFGVVALNDKSKVSDACISQRSYCSTEDAIGAASEMRTWAWASTVSLGVGVVAGVVGLVWPRYHASSNTSTSAYFDGRTAGLSGTF